MADPCECLNFFVHEARMRQLIAMLRNSQQSCTDDNCLDDFLSLAGRGGESGLFAWAFMALLIVAVILLYLMKPTRTRPQSKEGRTPDIGDRDDAGPVY